MYGYVIDLFLKTCLHNINRYTQITFGVCFRKGQKSRYIFCLFTKFESDKYYFRINVRYIFFVVPKRKMKCTKRY